MQDHIDRVVLFSGSGTGAGDIKNISPNRDKRSFMASVSTGSATVVIQVSNDGETWIDYVELTPTSTAPDGFSDVNSWPFVRANVTENAGTLTVTVGC